MLFPYRYVPHQMEKMQEFIDFIFYEVWCKAPGNGTFRLELFDGNADLKEVMHTFYFAEPQPKGAKFFYEHIERIYGHFTALTHTQIDRFKQWYKANNDIERVCANDPQSDVARYVDVARYHQELSKQLADFFKGLYSQELLDLAVLRQKIGHIDDHYQEFVKVNAGGKCPFCGIGNIKGAYHTKREAYDHYLPKGIYPFNSLNLHNLVPACHECNSTYKLGKDPVNTATGRRKAFYPYGTPSDRIKIKIDVKITDFNQLSPDHIELECGPAGLSEEIETWKEIYGIGERYKAICCGKNEGKYWLMQVFDEWQEDDRSPSDFLNALARQTVRNPFAESNFLKKAFLEGCHRAGLF